MSLVVNVTNFSVKVISFNITNLPTQVKSRTLNWKNMMKIVMFSTFHYRYQFLFKILVKLNQLKLYDYKVIHNNINKLFFSLSWRFERFCSFFRVFVIFLCLKFVPRVLISRLTHFCIRSCYLTKLFNFPMLQSV